MRKVLVALILVLLVAALLITGCGKSKKESSADDARKILEKSQKKMADITSVKVTGSTKAETPEAEQKETEYDFEVVTKVTPAGEAELHMVAKGDGEELQTYVVGEYAYTYDSDSGWVKQEISGVEELSTTGPTPAQLVEMTRFAENLSMLPEEGGSYVVSFDVSPKFFDQYATGLTEPADAGSRDGEAAPDISGFIKDLLEGVKISIVYKINKATMYADGSVLNISIEGIPMFGDITSVTDMAFSDFNKPVTITLPPEALNAKERELLPGELNIPSLPGLGF